MRLEADVRRGKDMAKTQERQLAQQREKLSELMGWVSENQESFERGMLTMSRIQARIDESDKRGRADVADAVQEIRVERANATSQRETAERTLARVEGTVVDLKTLSAGGITSAGPKAAAPDVAATKDAVVASGRPAIAAAGTKEGAEESVGDEEAGAREARRKYLAARAAVKGAVRGAEGGDSKGAEIKQTPMVGVRFNPAQKNPFSVELHHGGERFYLGSFSRAGPARYLSAVAQTVWHDRVQRSELMLTDQEEEEWTPDLDLARKMTAGLYAIIFIRKLAANHKRLLNIFKTARVFLDSKVKPTVDSAICAAIGLEAADDEPARVKGKAQKALYAGALAFGCAAMWSFTSAFNRSNTTGGAKTAFEWVTAEHRAAALQSASAAAKLCGASADDLSCLEACWADVYATIRKRQDEQMLSSASVEKSVLSVYADQEDKTVHVCVPLLVEVVANWNYDGSAWPSSKGVGLYLECEKARQSAKKRGTRGKGKKGEAVEKVGKKGEEGENDAEDDDENDTIMLCASESNEELA
ncbi:unnamed protein product [Closterium sp. Naga37s-1]|nr:unnamed protein product [Closterium sp. Naga37s-1]